MITDSIRWEVFTKEERTNLKKAINKGDHKVFTNIIIEMSPEKEAEVQKLVQLYRAQEDGYESQVRKDMETEFHTKNDITPEDEAEWQKKIDDEKAAMAKNSEKRADVKQSLNNEVAKNNDQKKEAEEKAKKDADEQAAKIKKEKEEAQAALDKEEEKEAQKTNTPAPSTAETKEVKNAGKKTATNKK